MFLGEIAALVAAASYASSSTLFSTLVKHSTPMLLNLQRGGSSTIFMFLILAYGDDAIFPDESARNYMLLIISGFLGISLGDSFYFRALHHLGVRKTILLETMAPPFTGIISYFYYGTTLSLGGWLGIFVTAYGIYIVVNEAQEKEHIHQYEVTEYIHLIDSSTNLELPLNKEPSQDLTMEPSSSFNLKKLFKGCEHDLAGLANGLAFTFCQAFGIVISHDASTSGKVGALQSALIRVLAGCSLLTVMIFFSKVEKFEWSCHTLQKNIIFTIGTILGPFVGIWSQQTALQHTRPEIVQTILATTPLFGLILSYLRGEKMRLKYFVGSFIAIFGVCIIIWC